MGRTRKDGWHGADSDWRGRQQEIRESAENEAFLLDLSRDARRGRAGQVSARVRRGIGFARG